MLSAAAGAVVAHSEVPELTSEEEKDKARKWGDKTEPNGNRGLA